MGIGCSILVKFDLLKRKKKQKTYSMLGIKLIQEFKQYVCVRYLHYERVELVAISFNTLVLSTLSKISVFQDCLPNINEGITPTQTHAEGQLINK